jgi:hypothetical protein
MPEDPGKAQRAALAKKKKEIADAIKRVTALLEAARREVLAEIADTDWDRFYLPRLTFAVNGALDRVGNLITEELAKDQAALWAAGEAHVTDTLAPLLVDLPIALPGISTSLLQALQRKSAQYIGGITQSAKDQIDRELAMIMLGAKSREDAIEAIGRSLLAGALPGRKPEGLFGSLAARMRFVTQHELGQSYAVARDLQRQQLERYAPGAKKVWVHDGHPLKPRPDHVAMHGQLREQDQPFVNPVTGEELMFPRDPSAEISETAGCTCDVVEWKPIFDEQGLEHYIGPATGQVEEAA